MSVNSCLIRIDNDPFVRVRKCYTEICNGNQCAAALINYYEHRHNGKLSELKGKIENNKKYKVGEDDYLIQASNQFLKSNLLNMFSRNSIIEANALLSKLGIIEIVTDVPNPNGGKPVNHILLLVDVINQLLSNYAENNTKQRLKQDVATSQIGRSQRLKQDVATSQIGRINNNNKDKYKKEKEKEKETHTLSQNSNELEAEIKNVPPVAPPPQTITEVTDCYNKKQIKGYDFAQDIVGDVCKMLEMDEAENNSLIFSLEAHKLIFNKEKIIAAMTQFANKQLRENDGFRSSPKKLLASFMSSSFLTGMYKDMLKEIETVKAQEKTGVVIKSPTPSVGQVAKARVGIRTYILLRLKHDYKYEDLTMGELEKESKGKYAPFVRELTTEYNRLLQTGRTGEIDKYLKYLEVATN